MLYICRNTQVQFLQGHTLAFHPITAPLPEHQHHPSHPIPAQLISFIPTLLTKEESLPLLPSPSGPGKVILGIQVALRGHQDRPVIVHLAQFAQTKDVLNFVDERHCVVFVGLSFFFEV